MPIEVLLADDHAMFRKGLVALLASRPEFAVVGEASDGCQAIARTRETLPDVVLMDVHMPNCDGLTAVRAIKREMPEVRIIMLTVDDQDEVLVESIRSGAHGYLSKKLDPKHLYDTITAVAAGEVALSPAMVAKILTEFQRPLTGGGQPSEPQEELTEREREVLQHVAGGASNREIADQLSITENTVKKHLQSMLAKLHLQNRIQLAVYAVRKELGYPR